jgi:hypothetical protein
MPANIASRNALNRGRADNARTRCCIVAIVTGTVTSSAPASLRTIRYASPS